ncbi:hypothetical protein TIFTF001_035228 [Ficus carica]|uniref:Uncharacterized protein n=1 Tax=Ficus carica TaxID=3494 RepID=A0AA88E1N2_FICCA|nr:hypothetical protein TIFTF001_035228 [Ficus carica]
MDRRSATSLSSAKFGIKDMQRLASFAIAEIGDCCLLSTIATSSRFPSLGRRPTHL